MADQQDANSSDEEDVTVPVTISRAAYRKAKEIAANQDEVPSPLGELAGTMETDEFLGWYHKCSLRACRNDSHKI